MTRPIAPEALKSGDGQPTSFRQILNDLNHAQKPGAGVPAYTRWVNRRLARYVAAASHKVGISANVVTFAGAMVSMVALISLVWLPRTPETAALVAVILAIGYVLDSADGQVSRLAGTSGPAGEWLDHVVDAIRTPAIHIAVFVALVRSGESLTSNLGYVALAYAIFSSGQFMSQILAEQLGRQLNRAAGNVTGGMSKSILLIPTDMGAICWIFIFWGWPGIFSTVYVLMFLINGVHSVVSMRRKYLGLRTLGH